MLSRSGQRRWNQAYKNASDRNIALNGPIKQITETPPMVTTSKAPKIKPTKPNEVYFKEVLDLLEIVWAITISVLKLNPKELETYKEFQGKGDNGHRKLVKVVLKTAKDDTLAELMSRLNHTPVGLAISINDKLGVTLRPVTQNIAIKVNLYDVSEQIDRYSKELATLGSKGNPTKKYADVDKYDSETSVSIFRNAYRDALRLNDTKTANILRQRFGARLYKKDKYTDKDKTKSVEDAVNVRNAGHAKKYQALANRKLKNGKPLALRSGGMDKLRQQISEKGTKRIIQARINTYAYTDDAVSDKLYLFQKETRIKDLGGKRADFAIKYFDLKLDRPYYSYYTLHSGFQGDLGYLMPEDRVIHSEKFMESRNSFAYVKTLMRQKHGRKKRELKPHGSALKPKPLISPISTTTPMATTTMVTVPRLPATITVQWNPDTNWDKKMTTKMDLKGVSFPASIPVGWEFQRTIRSLAKQIQLNYQRSHDWNGITPRSGDNMPDDYDIAKALTTLIGAKPADRPASKFKQGDWVQHLYTPEWRCELLDKPNWNSDYNEYTYTLYADGDEPTVLEQNLTQAPAPGKRKPDQSLLFRARALKLKLALLAI